MVRVRKLVLAIAAASALSSGMAHALGLGEVTLQSALNQPLVAEIELLEIRDLAANEVLPNLASPDEFNKAGVDRQYFLTDLKFTPIIKANGKSVIRVTSSKPVREPYLNFLVEVLWPNGRLLREYTLLLDPPLYSPQTAAAAAPQLPVAAPAPRAPASAPVASAASRAPVSAPAPSAAPVARSAAPGGEYRTTANDTLWEIAQRARGNGSVHQTMLAIQDLNPDAFIDGNINRMKSGQVLRLPEGAQITGRTQSEALAQVAEQNAAWRERRAVGTSVRQLDATRRSAAGAAPAQAQTEDSLKLLAADSGEATRGSDTGAAGSKALSDKLAVTQESLDSTRRENDELKSRLGDLEGQLDKLQRLIQLKDDQLAKLQADLAQPGSTASLPAGATEAPTAPAEAQPEATTPADPAAPEAEPQAQPDYNYAEPEAASPAPADAATPPAAEAEPVEPEPAKPVAPAQPAAPVEPVAERGMLDGLFANPMLLGIGGGIALLALLIALMMVSRRNAMKEADTHEERQLAGADASPYDSDLELPADSFDGMSDDLGSEPSNEAPVTAQTGDALGEADIYIAYGRFNQAAELLQNAINDEPNRADLRLKLMEVHAELGDREGFARQENELREIGGAAADVDQLKARYPAMAVLGAGFAAAAVSQDDLDSFSLDDLTLDEPQSANTPADLDDGFDLSLDDLSSDLDVDQPKSADAALADLDSLSLDSDLDLLAPSTPAAQADDLAFDLALDDEVQGDAALSDDLADFSLDLDSSASDTSEEDDFLLSLDDEPTPAAPVEPTPSLLAEEEAFDLPSDFDLSLGDDEPAAPTADSFAAQLDSVTAELDQLSESLDASPAGAPPPAVDYAAGLDADDDDDFDFLSGTDETATKLDLARAYIDMGDTEGARDILDEVVSEGNEGQQQEARELISKLV